MVRKILSGSLIVLSSLFLLSNLVGIGLIWGYRTTAIEEIDLMLADVDHELIQAQTALKDGQDELERALRIVDRAEEALSAFSEQAAVAKELLDTVTGVLDESIKPGLATSREKIDEAQKTLDDLRVSIEKINRIPFVNIPVPDTGILASFTEITDSLETEILRVEEIADEASTFMSDGSYLMGGDLQETRENIQALQKIIKTYAGKVRTWRGQVTTLRYEFPGWITKTAIWLTVFLLWFGFSQVGLFLHGLHARHGGDVLAPIRK